jgi:hypothetical protein
MSFLLLQNGDKLLLQNGDRLLLQADSVGGFQPAWAQNSTLIFGMNYHA